MDVVRDCQGGVCGDAVNDEEAQATAQTESSMWFLTADRADTSFVADRSVQ